MTPDPSEVRRLVEQKKPDPVYELVVCSGVEGPSVYLNDCRIAGPKPWGGGDVIHRWKVPRSAIGDAIGVEP